MGSQLGPAGGIGGIPIRSERPDAYWEEEDPPYDREY